MKLLEWMYWSDWMLVMQIFLVVSIIVLGILVIGLIRLLYKLIRPRAPDDKSYISKFSVYEGKQLIFSITGKLNFMQYELTDTQIAEFQLTFLDKKGGTTDAATVELALANAEQGTVEYDDPTNTVKHTAGLPGVTSLQITAKDSKGNVLPFDPIAVNVLAGDAVSGSIGPVTLTDQP